MHAAVAISEIDTTARGENIDTFLDIRKESEKLGIATHVVRLRQLNNMEKVSIGHQTGGPPIFFAKVVQIIF